MANANEEDEMLYNILFTNGVFVTVNTIGFFRILQWDKDRILEWCVA